MLPTGYVNLFRTPELVVGRFSGAPRRVSPPSLSQFKYFTRVKVSTGDSMFLFGICPCFFWFSPWHTIDISWPMGTDLCFLKSETEKSDTPEPRAAEKSDEFQSYCRFESGGPPVSLILEPGSAAITKKRIPGGHAIGHFLCPPRNPVREISDERPLYSPERPGYSPEPSL